MSDEKVGQLKWDTRFLKLAREISDWSRDPSTKVGAVAISSAGKLLVSGYNGLPRGIEDTPFRLNDRPTKYSLVCHAETNAIYNAAFHGVSLNGSSIYVHGLPVCSECAKALIQVGVDRVVMSATENLPQNWADSFKLTAELFQEAGIEYHFIDLTSEVLERRF